MPWDALPLLAGVALLTGLMLEGVLSPPLAAWMLVALAGFRAVARASGGVSGCVYGLFQLVFYGVLVVALLLHGDPTQAVLVLIKAFVGGFEQLLSQMLTLMVSGDVSFWLALLAIITLVFFRTLAWELASQVIYHAFCVLAPIFTFFLVVGRWGQAGPRELVLVAAGILCLFLVVEAVYIMVFGAVRSLKDH